MTLLETDLVERFGVEAAAYFPSGVMAQQAALRVHCDRAGSRRVSMPDLSHLLVHEDDGPRILQDLEIVFLTRGFEAPTAAHLEEVPGGWERCWSSCRCATPAACCHLGRADGAGRCLSCPRRGPAPRRRTDLGGADLVRPDVPGDSSAGRLDVRLVLQGTWWPGRCRAAGSRGLHRGSANVAPQTGGTTYRATAEAVSALAGLRERLPLIPQTVAGRASSPPHYRPSSPSNRPCRTRTSSCCTQPATPTWSTSARPCTSTSTRSACRSGRRPNNRVGSRASWSSPPRRSPSIRPRWPGWSRKLVDAT